MLLAALALSGVIPWRAVASSEVTYLDLGAAANQKLDVPFGGEYKPGNDLAALPRGEQVLAGCQFLVQDHAVQLAGKRVPWQPSRSAPIPVNRRFSTLALL